MKLEIKLNQEQFDLLVTSLVQIAQNTVRMANAWDTEQKEEKDPNSLYHRKWTDEEVDKAVTLYREGKTLQEIAEYLPGRTHDGVYNALLRRGIDVQKDSMEIRKPRTYPVIKNREKRPYHRQNSWTPEEDEKIVTWVKLFGTRWTELAKALPGRTVDSIQTRWHKALKNL